MKGQGSRKANRSLLFAIVFLTILVVITWFETNFLAILIVYYSMSLLTFTVYALDKAKAKRGSWRIAEAHLHLLALFGGWPGAVLAQQKLRHKSKKRSFRIMLLTIIVINLSCLSWLFSIKGQTLMSSVNQLFINLL